MVDAWTAWNMFQQLQGLGATALKLGQWLFSHKEGDIAVCNTRIERVPPGLPWNKKLGVHPLSDGSLHITVIAETPEDKFDRFSREDFYNDLKKVSRKSKK